jgi:hypothetical protein
MKIGLILWLFKSLGFNLQDFRGMHAKTRDDGLIPNKLRVSLTKLSGERVSDFLCHQIWDQRLRTDPRASARTRARPDQRARAVSDRGGEADWPVGPDARGIGGRQVGSDAGRAREAVSRDLGHAIRIERWRSTPGGLMAAGGAAPAHGGEVAGVGAGAGYGGSGVAEAGQKRRGRLGELTGGALTTRLGSERGERRRKGSGTVVYPVVRPRPTLAYSTLWRPDGRRLQSTPLKRSKDPLEYHGVLLCFS